VCNYDDNKRGHNFDTKGRFAVQKAMEYTANTMILRNFSESCKTTHDLVLVVARGHGRGAKVFVHLVVSRGSFQVQLRTTPDVA
jgi:hypothetical protein